MLLQIANKIAGRFGYKVKIERKKSPGDIYGNEQFVRLYEQCSDYTMTSLERMYSLYQSLNYIIDNNIPGDLVECGVWKGGSSRMMALLLKERGVTNRKLHLYDTFEGMSEPSEFDTSFRGDAADKLLAKEKKNGSKESIWCYAPLEEVRENLYSTGYPKENIVFVKGKVEDTLSLNMPGKLALLRLDTDWYESTKIELELLYPLLVEKGVLIIDDFGHWDGAKKAVVEYFEKTNYLFLHRIDYTGRLMIK